MNYLAMIFKLLGGGVTGYITNDLAIKMLFRKYGPFGGVILETKDEFIENISQLVERDIINYQTIEQELSKKEFKQAFQATVSDLLERYLYQNTENIQWSKIPKLDESLENISNFYDQKRSGFITEFLDILAENILVEELLSVEQLEQLLNLSFDLFTNTLAESKVVDNLLDDIYNTNSTEELVEFIPATIFKTLAINLEDSTRGFHVRLKDKFEASIDENIEKLYSELSISDILAEIEEKVKAKSLAEILGEKQVDDISNQLLLRVIEFFKSAEGKRLIYNFLEGALELLKQIDLPILSLLSEDIKENLEKFMYKQLPYLVEEGVRWIRANQQEIEELIEESIDEVLEKGSGVKNWIKGQIKESLGNIARRFQLIDKLLLSLEDDSDIKTLSRELSHQIINYIKDNSIKDIIDYLESRDLIRIQNLVKLIDRNIDRYLDGIDLSGFDRLFEISLGEIININLAQYFDDNIKDNLIEKFKEDFLFTPQLTEILQRELFQQIIKVAQLKLAELIDEESLEASLPLIKGKIIGYLRENHEIIITKVREEVEAFVKGKSFSELFTDKLKEELVNNLGDKSSNYLKESLSGLQEQRITELYDRLNQQEDVVQRITALILELVNKNLPLMLEGKVKGAVADNLYKLEDKQVQDVVEGFMGKELKPITQLGALLGIIAALILYLIQGSINLSQLGWLNFILSTFTYGFVGYFTNVLALRMIFRPYSEKKLLGQRVPFTPGVVAKNKPRFADSMGKFVDEQLLNGESINKLFKDNRVKIEDDLKSLFAKDNYLILNKLLVKNRGLISEKVFISLLNVLKFNGDDLVNKLLNQLKEIDILEVDLSLLEAKLASKLETILLESEDILTERLFQFINNKNSLKEFLPESLKVRIIELLKEVVDNELTELVALIDNPDKIQQLLTEYSPKFDELIEEKLMELIPSSHQKALKDFIVEYSLEKFKSTEIRQQSASLIENNIFKKINPEDRIKDLFNGKLMNPLYDNMDFIINNFFNKGIRYLQYQKRFIKDMALEVVEEEFAREQISGIGGLITGYFKRGVYNLTDTAETIESIIDNLIDEKLPEFIKLKEQEIVKLVNRFLDKVGDRRLKEIGIDLDSAALMSLVDKLLANENLVNSLSVLVARVVDSILELKLKSVSRIMAIDDISDMLEFFTDEIDVFSNSLSSNLRNKEGVIKENLLVLFSEILDRLILSLPLNQLAVNISRGELKKVVNKIIETIHSTPTFEENLSIFMKDIIAKLAEKNIDKILNFDYLAADIKKLLARMIDDGELRYQLLIFIKKVIEEILAELNSMLESDTKGFCFEIILASSLDSLESHFLELLTALNIKEVTELEVNQMSSQDIEDLFNSFAGRYFRRLEAYGWMGSVVGVFTELLSIIL
ncbi:uncharacterized membrane protein YheB (UPF0754 family) [Orenia metallireducens]|uniref:DUF445 family protein n=1 Tax=Orenia metallireducens TaxID=1413210 RepID=UPI000D068E69|nr:DUF445 family protein [Orenia metallireducens]PRX26925.1 uncharacterized membrane protein YheB (UPF0754 family) [Orenia metallireducens]